MKKYLLATSCTAALVGGATAALAADLPVKAPAYMPPAPSAPEWSGFYLGGHIGVARMNATANAVQPDNYGYYGPCQTYYAGSASCTSSDTSLIGGIQGGVDFQSGSFVYGFVADWSWTGLDHTLYNNGGSGYGGTDEFKVDWLASFRGRMGLAVDRTLVYFTGGVALGGLKSSSFNYQNQDYGSLDKTGIGWVAGLGVEHKFTPHWSVMGEFLYYDLKRQSGSAVASDGDYTYTTEYSHEIMVGRAGLNYRF